MNKGFSLVELIVVIAIMAILVGVAVPVYTNYISKAEDGVKAQYLDELDRAIDTVTIDLQAGLTKKDSWTNTNVPTYINIVDGDIEALDATGADCDAFIDLLNDIIAIDAEIDVEIGERPSANN